MIPPYLTVTYFSFATGENTLREFPLVIATVAKVSRKRGLWLVVRVKKSLYTYIVQKLSFHVLTPK